MKQAGRLLCLCLLVSLGLWAQDPPSAAPKSRKAHSAPAHKMSSHPARKLSIREKQERARMSADQRRQAKLAKKQRKEAKKRSRRLDRTAVKAQ